MKHKKLTLLIFCLLLGGCVSKLQTELDHMEIGEYYSFYTTYGPGVHRKYYEVKRMEKGEWENERKKINTRS